MCLVCKVFFQICHWTEHVWGIVGVRLRRAAHKTPNNAWRLENLTENAQFAWFRLNWPRPANLKTKWTNLGPKLTQISFISSKQCQSLHVPSFYPFLFLKQLENRMLHACHHSFMCYGIQFDGLATLHDRFFFENSVLARKQFEK